MQDRKPLVSVIMPSLNVVKYIDECIQSVLNQSLKEIEIPDNMWMQVQQMELMNV